MSNNKKGYKTEVDPFWNLADIKGMIDFFKSKEMWNWYITFMIGLLLGRRVGDTLGLKWRDLYYKNGCIRDKAEIVEQKTGKQSDCLYICGVLKDALQLYADKIGMESIREHLDEYIVPSKAKTKYDDNISNAELYKRELKTEDKETLYSIMEEWKVLLGKHFKGKWKENLYKEYLNIENSHKKGKSKFSFIEFLIDKEWTMAIKSQSSAYRTQFTRGALECGITYNVSTHSTRKTFGYWSVKLHPYDVTTIDTLQVMYQHESRNQTIHYCCLDKENAHALFDDMGNLIGDVQEGKEISIAKNMPVVSIKREDLRNILLQAYEYGNSGIDKGESLNKLLSVIDDKSVSKL